MASNETHARPPTQAAVALSSDAPPKQTSRAHEQPNEQQQQQQYDKQSSANREQDQARTAANELERTLTRNAQQQRLATADTGRSVTFEEAPGANRTTTSLYSGHDDDFDDEDAAAAAAEDLDQEAAAAAATSSPALEAADEPSLRRRASLVASLVPDNRRLAALLAGRGPLTSELKRLAERARRRRNKSKLKNTAVTGGGGGGGKSKLASAKQSNTQQQSHRGVNHAPPASKAQHQQQQQSMADGKSVQTRQGLATTTASTTASAHLDDLTRLSLLAEAAAAGQGQGAAPLRAGHNAQQLAAQLKQLNSAVLPSLASGGSLPQLSSAIQRLLSSKFGIAGGGRGGIYATGGANETMPSGYSATTAAAAAAAAKKQNYPTSEQLADFSSTSANSDEFGGDFAANSQLLPFELAAASGASAVAPAEGQLPQTELDEADEIGQQQQQHNQQHDRQRLSDLMSRWQAVAASSGPSEVYASGGGGQLGGLLSLQAAQQRNKLQQTTGGSHSLLDLPTDSSAASGGGGGQQSASKKQQQQQQQQLIPIEIIGLDPSVTNSILYGSIGGSGGGSGAGGLHNQQQQQQRPLLSASSQQDQYQAQAELAGAPPDGRFAQLQQQQKSNGQAGASELDIQGEDAAHTHQELYSHNHGDGGQKLLAEGQQESAAAAKTGKESPVLHVHHFHHTSGELPPVGGVPTLNSQDSLAPNLSQQDAGSAAENGEQESASQQQKQAAAGGEATGTGGSTAGDPQAQEVVVSGTAGESEAGASPAEEEQQQEAGDSQQQQQQANKLRFVTHGSQLRGKQLSTQDGRPPRLARPHSNFYTASRQPDNQTRFVPLGGEPGAASQHDDDAAAEQEQQNNYETHSEHRQPAKTNNLLMVSYKPASMAHQLSYQQQQQQQQQQFYGTPEGQEEEEAAARGPYEPLSSFNPNFQRPPPPYNEGSESAQRYQPGGGRLSAPSNLSQQIIIGANNNSNNNNNNNNNNSSSNLQAANLMRSLVRQQQLRALQAKIAAAPNEPGHWSSEDERLLAQFNQANGGSSPSSSSHHHHHQQQQPARLPLLLASSNSSSASKPTNPFSNHYQQFVDNLAALRQLRAQQHSRPATNHKPAAEQLQQLMLANNLAGAELAQAVAAGALNGTESNSSLTPVNLNSRYELASASDRFAQKLLRGNSVANQTTTSTTNNLQRPPRPSLQSAAAASQSAFTANDNFHVPNTASSGNRSSLDALIKQQQQQQQQSTPPVPALEQKTSATGRAQLTGAKSNGGVITQEQVQVQHATASEPTANSSFMDSANGLSNLALAFIFVVSLLTFILIAASLIYRRRRGHSASARCGGVTLASAGDGRGGGHSGPLGSHGSNGGGGGGGRLNLTQRTKHLVRSSFSARGGDHIPDTLDQSNGSSLKSISHLGDSCDGGGGGRVTLAHLAGPNKPQVQQVAQKRQLLLKSALKQPQQQQQSDHNNNNYINKYICANGGPPAPPPGKTSRFFSFNPLGQGNGDKYQSADEQQAVCGESGGTFDLRGDNSSQDIKTLNTRLATKAAGPSSGGGGGGAGRHQQPNGAGHRKVAAAAAKPQMHRGPPSGDGGGGAKYKNLPPPPPPSQQVGVACLKHAML